VDFFPVEVVVFAVEVGFLAVEVVETTVELVMADLVERYGWLGQIPKAD
jgi:hypothetical protein